MKSDDRPRNYRKEYSADPSRAPPRGASRRGQSAGLSRLDDPVGEHGRVEGKRAPGKRFDVTAMASSARRPPLPSKRRWRRSRAGIARC